MHFSLTDFFIDTGICVVLFICLETIFETWKRRVRKQVRRAEMMTTTEGTPKYLDDAIANAICIGPASETPDRLYYNVKDLAAQRFGACILELQAQHMDAAAEIVMRYYNGFIRREE
jgi:hypothetical protein